MDHFATALDRWITTQDESDLDCPECETPLGDPIGTTEQVEHRHCDGKTYTIKGQHSPEVMAIIGTDNPYFTEVMSPCPEFADNPVDHEPHTEVEAVAIIEQYGCECGWKGSFTTL